MDKNTALEKLRHYCVYQDRCHKEVRNKLLDLGIKGYDLEEIMAILIEERFLDEERFAKSFARGKFYIKKWGRVKIIQALKFRNISAFCLKSALKEIDEADYHNALQQLLVSKYPHIKASNIYQRKNKLAQFAIQKGYESSLVWEKLKTTISE